MKVWAKKDDFQVSLETSAFLFPYRYVHVNVQRLLPQIRWPSGQKILKSIRFSLWNALKRFSNFPLSYFYKSLKLKFLETPLQRNQCVSSLCSFRSYILFEDKSKPCSCCEIAKQLVISGCLYLAPESLLHQKYWWVYMVHDTQLQWEY